VQVQFAGTGFRTHEVIQMSRTPPQSAASHVQS
jgi:hypothetical protein